MKDGDFVLLTTEEHTALVKQLEEAEAYIDELRVELGDWKCEKCKAWFSEMFMYCPECEKKR